MTGPAPAPSRRSAPGTPSSRTSPAALRTRPVAKAWLLDRKIVANEVGLGLLAETRAFLDELPTAELARYLIGGLSTLDLPSDLRPGYVALARESLGVPEYLMPPLPNTLYTRDTTQSP